MIGDVVGKPGRRAVEALVPSLRQEHGIDLVVANGENAAGGFGLTLDTAHELLDSGVDVLTSGTTSGTKRRSSLTCGKVSPWCVPPTIPTLPAGVCWCVTAC